MNGRGDVAVLVSCGQEEEEEEEGDEARVIVPLHYVLFITCGAIFQGVLMGYLGSLTLPLILYSTYK